MNLVVRRLVGGRIPQHRQWFEVGQRIQRLAAFHLLRLIQEHDGPVGADDVNGPAGLEIVQLFINATRILARGIEGLHVNHHDVDARVAGKAFQVVQLLGVVNKEPGALFVVVQKVLRCDFQRLVHALTNGNAGHHHNELAPPIAGVQLEHAFDVAIRLAGAGLHFHVQIDVAHLGFDQRGGQGQVFPALHRMDVFQYLA
ncbi:MAG: hypothetical protein ACD_23C00718G0001, partial [uncultured bacterium]